MEIKTLNKTLYYAVCTLLILGASLEVFEIDMLTDFLIVLCLFLYFSAAIFRVYRKGEEWSSIAELINPGVKERIALGTCLVVIAFEHGWLENSFGRDFWLTGSIGLLLVAQAASMRFRRLRAKA